MNTSKCKFYQAKKKLKIVPCNIKFDINFNVKRGLSFT